ARCWALARASRPYHSAGAITALLDLGWKSSLIGLVCGGVVIYQRKFDATGLASLFNQIATEFRLAEDETDYVLRHIGVAGDQTSEAQAKRIEQVISRSFETMMQEIQAAFHYAAHRYPETAISSLHLVGGGSTVAGVNQWLSSRLNVPVETLSPARIVQCSD